MHGGNHLLDLFSAGGSAAAQRLILETATRAFGERQQEIAELQRRQRAAVHPLVAEVVEAFDTATPLFEMEALTASDAESSRRRVTRTNIGRVSMHFEC